MIADPNELELSLLNLAINARDAMPEGGTMTVTAENVLLTRRRPTIAGDFVAICVADTGTGIAPDILPKIFDPFFTTKRRRARRLGFSQVHGFTHQSGGKVTIDSALGQGTRITLYLPRAEAGRVAREVTPGTGQLGGGLALLVEDNPEVAEVTIAMIEQLGYRVETADGPAAALDLVERTAFALVVSDIVMAGTMDGAGLARALRQRHPNLPICCHRLQRQRGGGRGRVHGAAQALPDVGPEPRHDAGDRRCCRACERQGRATARCAAQGGRRSAAPGSGTIGRSVISLFGFQRAAPRASRMIAGSSAPAWCDRANASLRRQRPAI